MRQLVPCRCAGGRASVTPRTEYVGCKATFCFGCDVRASRVVPAAHALPLLNTTSSHDDVVVAYVGPSLPVLSHTVLRAGLGDVCWRVSARVSSAAPARVLPPLLRASCTDSDAPSAGIPIPADSGAQPHGAVLGAWPDFLPPSQRHLSHRHHDGCDKRLISTPPAGGEKRGGTARQGQPELIG